MGADWDRHPLYLSCLKAMLVEAERQGPRDSVEPESRQRGDRSEPLLDQRLRQLSRRRQRQGRADD